MYKFKVSTFQIFNAYPKRVNALKTNVIHMSNAKYIVQIRYTITVVQMIVPQWKFIETRCPEINANMVGIYQPFPLYKRFKLDLWTPESKGFNPSQVEITECHSIICRWKGGRMHLHFCLSTPMFDLDLSTLKVMWKCANYCFPSVTVTGLASGFVKYLCPSLSQHTVRVLILVGFIF